MKFYFVIYQRRAGAEVQESPPAGVGVFQQDPEWIFFITTRPGVDFFYCNSTRSDF